MTITKTKRQLRAEAVEQLKNCVAARFDAESIVIALTSGRRGQSDWSLECDKLIYLLTDDANDDSTPEKVVRTASVDANDVKVSTMPLKMPSEIRWHYTDGGEYTQKLAGDSREKLEADVRQYVLDAWAQGWEAGQHDDMDCCNFYIDEIRVLLDRQAAITERKATKRHELFCETCEAESDKRIAELQEQVDELTTERVKLQEQLLIGWECECRLQAEREDYRKKFGKCLDYADAIHALMDDEGMA